MRKLIAVYFTGLVCASSAWGGYLNLPAATMQAAWQQQRNLSIPGVPVNMSYSITGSTYYVATNGSDSNDGSFGSPWLTLTYAGTKLAANTVIYARGGTYQIGGTGSSVITLSTAASSASPAAFRAYPGEQPVVQYSQTFIDHWKGLPPPSNHYPPLVDITGSYIEFSGFHLIGARATLGHNQFSENGVSIETKGTGVRVLYNEIEQAGHCGVKAMDHGETSFLVEGNYIHDIGIGQVDHCVYASVNDVTVRKNILTNATGYGVHSYNGAANKPTRLNMSYNITAGNTWFGAIMSGPSNTVANNVLYNDQKGGIIFFRGGSKNNIAKNNLIYAASAFSYDSNGGSSNPSGNTADYNILSPGTSLGTKAPSDYYGSHNLTTDPKVANAAILNFIPNAGSPLVDAGIFVGTAYYGSAPDVGIYEMLPVRGRYVFYNNSKFDGNDPAANAADDGAIATDKTSLLPGGTASFANYTSYSRGINSIMVDIANLPAGTPTAADFTFKVGNDSTPSAWATAPAPTSITVRRGAGTGGSDRITILWADNAIQKQWLQVTVLANSHTGLTAADVFYWGNAIGDTGNSTTDAQVTPADEIVVRNNPHTLQQNPAPITDPCDFARDGKVGPTDEIIVRNNATNAGTALKLITPP